MEHAGSPQPAGQPLGRRSIAWHTTSPLGFDKTTQPYTDAEGYIRVLAPESSTLSLSTSRYSTRVDHHWTPATRPQRVQVPD
jgi:hypothetical protein